MITFKEHISTEQNTDIESVIEELTVLYALDENEIDMIFSGETLNEVNMSKLLSKIGLTIHKEKGIIQYLRDATVGIAKCLLYAIKGDKENLKKTAKSLRKEDVLDFLLKLDMATLHIVTGPIHFIDAVTGWDLWANISEVAKTTKEVAKKVVKAIDIVKTNITKLIHDKKVSLYSKFLDKLEKDIAKA